MKTRNLISLLSITYVVISAISCSTVKVIPEGGNRLKENRIIITNSKEFNPAELEPYIKQKPNSYYIFKWNPFLNIYNWSTGSNSGWDKFVKKIGQAPVVLDTNSVSRTRENFVNHLKTLGYYNSRVEDSVVIKRRKASVTYKVQLGKRYVINKIDYKVQDTAIKGYVDKDRKNSMVVLDSYLSEKTLAAESERVASLLRKKGFYNFSKNYFFFEADTLKKSGYADLTVKIENYTRNELPKDRREHKRYIVRNITIYPDYDPLDSIRIYDSLIYNGIKIKFESEKPNVRPTVLNSINRIQIGKLYDESVVNNTYNRFNDLRIFSGVNIQFDETGMVDTLNRGMVDCSIRLAPSKTQGYKINLEASNNSNGLLGISPALSYYHKNIFNGGEWLNLGFMGNFQFKLNDPVKSTELGVSASISLPDFLFIPDKIFKTTIPRTDIGMTYNYQNRPEFTRNLISFSYGYNWKSGDKFFYRVNPIQLSVVRLFNMSKSFYESLKDPFIKNSYRNYFDLGAGATLLYTTDPSPNPKRSFFYIRWNNDISGNILSMFNGNMPKDSTGAHTIWGTAYSQYLRTEMTAVYTFKFGEKSAIASRFNVGIGYAYGNSKSIPFEKLFYAGGANSLRGWQARTVGPGSSQIDTTFSIPNQTGDIKLEFNTELRFPMFWKMEGALFVDAGNIWTMRSEKNREEGLFKFSDFYRNIALNWGLGARLNLDFLILRLDMGMIAYDPARKLWINPSGWFKKDSFSFQFGVGYPF
ncbi:MAG: BamA/TamA family outer membrane protein [Bacteroidales bacterium]